MKKGTPMIFNCEKIYFFVSNDDDRLLRVSQDCWGDSEEVVHRDLLKKANIFIRFGFWIWKKGYKYR